MLVEQKNYGKRDREENHVLFILEGHFLRSGDGRLAFCDAVLSKRRLNALPLVVVLVGGQIVGRTKEIAQTDALLAEVNHGQDEADRNAEQRAQVQGPANEFGPDREDVAIFQSQRDAVSHQTSDDADRCNDGDGHSPPKVSCAHNGIKTYEK